MGEISEALKRARTRLNKEKIDDATKQATPDKDGFAQILRREREARHAIEPRLDEDLRPAAAVHPLPAERAARKSHDFSFTNAEHDQRVSAIVVVAPESQYAVRFRHLAIRVRSELAKRRRGSLLVTSAISGEGKTTISINLALALSSIALDSKIALVDLDLRRSRVAAALGCSVELGFEETLAGRASLDDSRITTNFENLDLYAIRESDRAAHESLGGAAALAAIEQLHSRYDYVIFDGPPVLPVPDVPLVAPNIGGCLLVIRSRVTRHAAVSEIMELLPRQSMIGVFLNDAMTKRGRSGYGYYEQYASAEVKD